MSIRVSFIISLCLCALSLGVGMYYYQALPATMAGHWDATGAVNGSISKFWGVALLPLLMLVILWVLMIVPRIDPLRKNFVPFRRKYNIFLVLLMLFFTGVQLAVLAVNLGALFNIQIAIMPLVGILFFYIGMIMPGIKRNYFMGIRTPWTLASDEVWEKTHRLGSVLFKVLGGIAVLSILAPTAALVVFIVPTFVVVIGLVFYSYAAYREIGMRTS